MSWVEINQKEIQMLKRNINGHTVKVRTIRRRKQYLVEVFVDGEMISSKKYLNLRYVEIVHMQDENNCYFQNNSSSDVYLKVVSFGYKHKYTKLDFKF